MYRFRHSFGQSQFPKTNSNPWLAAEQQKQSREELRQAIKDYEPGMAAEISFPDTITKVNINLFGQMSAGKSTFINTLNFAFKGKITL